MDKIVALATRAPKSKVKHDDDFVDRLNSRYTSLVLVVFTVVLSVANLGKPITCWSPKHFTGAHTKFARSYCWVKNTYYLPLEEEIPAEHEDHKRDVIIYYQWIPFIMLTQVWHGLNQRGGVDADNILESASTFENSSKVEKKSRTLKIMVNQLDRFLGSRQVGGGGWRKAGSCWGKRMGSYLLVLYMFSKLLYIANIVGQLFLLDRVFRTSYHTFGVDFLREVISGRPWIDNTHFPRVTFCDFPVRRLGNVHRYTVQCVLPLNLYLEIMYVFLWFWMVALAIITGVNLGVWLLRAILYSDRVKFIKNHLRGGDRDAGGREVAHFVGDYLRQDGCLILRLIAHNTNNITVTEIVCALWDFWREKQEKRGKLKDPEAAMNGGDTDGLKPKSLD